MNKKNQIKKHNNPNLKKSSNRIIQKFKKWIRKNKKGIKH